MLNEKFRFAAVYPLASWFFLIELNILFSKQKGMTIIIKCMRKDIVEYS